MPSWMEFIWKVCPLVVFSFSILWLLTLLKCSGVVVADRKANRAQVPGDGQG